MNRIEVGGIGLEVAQIPAPEGAEDHAAIVFLHEGLGSVAMWRDWPEVVCRATARAGLVYSRRGYGRSDRTPDCRGEPGQSGSVRSGRLLPDYLHHEALHVLPELLDKLSIASPVVLGHSDGASIGLIHASHFPVTACIAMAPHVMVEDVSIEAIRLARTAYLQGKLRQGLERYHAHVDCAFWQWNDAWLSPGFRSFDIRDACSRIQAPVLAIQGANDPYGTLAQIEQIDLPLPRLTRAVLEACGHSPHRDQQERTTQLIRDLLAKLP